jgi:glutamate racemase
MGSSGPLGAFDSGVGGLSVLRQIRTLLPTEDLVFVADSGHVPYGNKSRQFIKDRALAISRFLIEQGAKAIVVACNTATAVAVDTMRSSFPPMPVVGMEPAVRPAVAATKTGVIGVLATVGTLDSARFAGLLDRFAQGVTVETRSAPGLVEAIESGDVNGQGARALVERYTRPLIEANADTIVLGSTHYHFVRELVADVVGPQITVIETGHAVAKQVQRVLDAGGLLRSSEALGTERFWTSGDPELGTKVISSLWKRDVPVSRLPPEFAWTAQ